MYAIILKISWALRSSWMQIYKPSTNMIKGTFFKMVDEDGDKPSPKFTCHDDFYRSVRGKIVMLLVGNQQQSTINKFHASD